ncbi:MAG: gluconate 5-dehydrogenase [Deltaproteobacteria bacterium]|nr:gluconate 5-dehydrogenase [Deltaproteobacteria bacterium]
MSTPPPYRDLFDLSGKVALVTGGGRGIGLAIAEGLGSWGARIAIAELDETRCNNAVEQLQAAGIEAVPMPADITQRDALPALFDRIESALGPLDILVNNAGVSARIPCEAYPDDNFDAMVELNLGAVFRCMREAASRWIDAGRPGRIINLASFAGMVADPLSAPYAATKGAVVQLTRTCAVEWASHGILVNAIGPGYVRTEMTAHTLDTPEAGAVIRAKTALGRAANTSEMAGAAVYLASAASSYTTGHILMVDGGWTAM